MTLTGPGGLWRMCAASMFALALAVPVAAQNITAVSGNITVQETVAGNEVSSLWVENVVARNISNKPILLLVGVLDAVGPRSDGGYELVIDRFFSERLIQPAETIPLPYGTGQRGECCINPLGDVNEPKASFRVEFVQFVDGSTFANPATADQRAEHARRQHVKLRHSETWSIHYGAGHA